MSNSEEREVLRRWRQSRRQHRENVANQDDDLVGDKQLSDQEGESDGNQDSEQNSGSETPDSSSSDSEGSESDGSSSPPPRNVTDHGPFLTRLIRPQQ